MSHTTTRGVAFCRPHQSARTRLRAIKANAAQRGVHPPASGWASIAACRGVCTFCTFCISTRCPTSPASTDLQQRLAPLQSARALLAGAAQPCGSGLAADDRQCRRLQSPNATRLAAWRHGGMAPQVRPRPMVSMGWDGTHSYIGSPGDCYSATPCVNFEARRLQLTRTEPGHTQDGHRRRPHCLPLSLCPRSPQPQRVHHPHARECPAPDRSAHAGQQPSVVARPRHR